jgi:hypothetical protein
MRKEHRSPTIFPCSIRSCDRSGTTVNDARLSADFYSFFSRQCEREKNREEHQDCQMVIFQTKNTSLGKFCRVLQWEMVVYFMAVWSILPPFGISGGHWVHLVYFSPFWYYVTTTKIWQP